MSTPRPPTTSSTDLPDGVPATEPTSVTESPASTLRASQRAAQIVRRFLDRLPGGRFTRSVAIVAGGTALGQAIVIAASPILTRLYTPEHFGVLGIFSSLLGIFAVLASLRYELAVPLPDEDRDAASLVMLCLVVLPVTALTLSLALWLFGCQITSLTKAPALAAYLWLLPLGVVFLGVYAVFSSWAVRKKAYREIARTRVTQSIAGVAAQIALFPVGLAGLLVGTILGGAAGTLTLWRFFARNRPRRVESDTTSLVRFAQRYRRFPLFSGPSAFVNTAAAQLPLLFLAVIHGPVVTGYYVLGSRAVSSPLRLVSRSSAQVFFAEAAPIKQSKEQLLGLFWTVSRQQAYVGLPLLLLMPVASLLFAILFGSAWREAGVFVSILIPGLYAQFIASPSGTVLDVLERQDLHLMREIVRAVLFGLAGVSAILMNLSPHTTVGLFSAALMIQGIVYAGISWYSIHRHT